MEMSQQKGDGIYPPCMCVGVHCSGTWTPWTLTNDHRYEPRKILVNELIEMIHIKNVANVNVNANTSRYNQFKWMQQTIHVATISQAPLTSNIFCIWLALFMSLQQFALVWKNCIRRKDWWHGEQHWRWGWSITCDKLTSPWLLSLAGVLSSNMKYVKKYSDLHSFWLYDIRDMKNRQPIKEHLYTRAQKHLYQWKREKCLCFSPPSPRHHLPHPQQTHTPLPHTSNSHTHTHAHTFQFLTPGLGWSMLRLGLAPAEVTSEF